MEVCLLEDFLRDGGPCPDVGDEAGTIMMPDDQWCDLVGFGKPKTHEAGRV